MPVGTTISMLSSWHISFLVISVLTIIIGAALYWLVPRDSDQVTGSIKSQLRLMGDRRIVHGVVVMIAQLNWLLGLIGVMFILGNTAAGIVSSHYGIAKMPQVSAACLILLLVMGLAFHLSWMGIALLCLICFVLGMPGSILQVMFLNVADRDYPEAISLASSLNPICTNVGVSVGSLVASISVNFVPISQVGYIGAIFALIGVVGTMMLVKTK